MELHRTSAMGMCRIMSEARCGATRLASTVGSIQVALGFLMGTDSGQVLRIRRSSSLARGRTTCCGPLQGRNRSWRNRVELTASLLKHSGLTHPRIGCCFYGQRACCTQSCGRLFVMIAKAVCRSRKNKNFYGQPH